ncbi:hypothetical protein IAT38_000082 [Cryptococcus sp. DSM 104549]
MALTDYFSPVAFFILLRESLEAGIIIAVLLGFISQIVPSTTRRLSHSHSHSHSHAPAASPSHSPVPLPRQSEESNHSSTQLFASRARLGAEESTYGTSRSASPAGRERRGSQNGHVNGNGAEEYRDDVNVERDGEVIFSPSEVPGDVDRVSVMRKMRVQIWSGAVLGGSVAMCIGAVFLYVFYHYTHDLWQDAENLWEGGFCLIAAALILIMSLAFLRLPHAQTKWRLKLLSAYHSHRSRSSSPRPHHGSGGLLHPDAAAERHKHKAANRATAILFGLPFITVLREGLEGVVFLGGIGLSETPSAVAGGGILGLLAGALCAYLLFSSTSPMSLHKFTTVSSLLLFVIGAGLASRSAYSLERQYFISHVGTAAAESGNGPGSYRVQGNIWHLTWWDPEPGSGDNMAQLAQAVFGWNNTGTWWTVSTYMAYWIAIMATLTAMKWREGRTSILGYKSRRGIELERTRKQRGGVGADDEEVLLDDRSDVGE